MTKLDFLQQLREGLEGEVSSQEIESSISYYRGYIDDEISSGKTEEEVLNQIGSPRLIVKSIIEAKDGGRRRVEREREEEEERQRKEEAKPRFHTDINDDGKLDIRFGKFSFTSWYGKLLIALVIIVVLVLVAFLAIKLLPIVLTIVLVVIFIRFIVDQTKK